MFLCLKLFSLFKHFLVQLYLRMFTADMIGHLCWFSHTYGLLESLTRGHCLVFQCHGNKTVQFQRLVIAVVVDALSGLAHLIFYQKKC